MIPLGLSGSDQQAFHDGLRTNHERHVRVQILSLDHDVISDVSSMLYDGQVDVDQHGTVSRSLSLSLLDPRGTLPFDSNSPADAALSQKRMIRVTDSRYIDALSDWVDVPAFTGPVTKLDRQDDIVEIEASGKESLTASPVAAWHPLTIPKGWRNTTGIYTILSQRGGESRFDLGDFPRRMANALVVGRQDAPWGKALQLSSAINRQLFYDGLGRCRLRRFPQVPHFTFDGRSVCGPIQVSFTPITANVVNVVGGVPPKKKDRVHFTARAAVDNPVSPWELGRHDQQGNLRGRFIPDFIENDQIRSTADARDVANRTLAATLRMGIEVTFDALPIPHLEPGDAIQVWTDRGSVVFPLRQFSLPLVCADGNTMSVGVLRNVRVRRRAARRR